MLFDVWEQMVPSLQTVREKFAPLVDISVRLAPKRSAEVRFDFDKFAD